MPIICEMSIISLRYLDIVTFCVTVNSEASYILNCLFYIQVLNFLCGILIHNEYFQ